MPNVVLRRLAKLRFALSPPKRSSAEELENIDAIFARSRAVDLRHTRAASPDDRTRASSLSPLSSKSSPRASLEGVIAFRKLRTIIKGVTVFIHDL